MTATLAARDQHLKRLGVLLLVVAAALFVWPPRYEALQTVGSRDGRTLDAAGYETRRAGPLADRPVVVHRGDEMLYAIRTSQHSAAYFRAVSERRTDVLYIAVPGAFLLGLTRRRQA